MDLRRLALLPEPLKKGFLEGIDPLADGLIKAGLTPNRITTLSTFLIVAAGGAYALGGLRLGGALLLLSGLFDLLDGKVARRGNLASKFGAFFDSSMDRLGEGALFTGIAIFYMTSTIKSWGQHQPVLALGLCFACLTGSFLVSYTRARAESLGFSASVGMATRAERIIFLGGPTLFFGSGPGGYLLLGILAFLTLISWITVYQRIAFVYHASLNEPPAPPVTRTTVPGPIAASVGKGH
jgi:CDP-diacylglycerol--glycerol-3-phosphate 3-phosphatidyltransferase